MELRRAVIIGCGPRAAEHVAAYRRVRRGRVVAAAARTQAHAIAFCDAHGIERSYDDARRMLEEERPDLVHIVTMPDQRVPLMTLAADCHVPVAIVEKPIAIEAEDRRLIGALVSSSSTRFVVNTQLHFHPRIAEFRRIVEEGRIGAIRFIDISAGSTISDQGVHLLELAHAFAADAEPIRVFAQVAGGDELDSEQPSPDLALAAIEFAGGLPAHMVTGESAPRPAEGEPFYMQKRIAVYGTRGSLHWSMFDWERFTDTGGYERGTHEYAEEDEAGQGELTDSAFALLEDGGGVHATRVERSLVEFDVVLAAYVSALQRRPVDLPCDAPDGLIAAMREALSGHAR